MGHSHGKGGGFLTSEAEAQSAADHINAERQVDPTSPSKESET